MQELALRILVDKPIHPVKTYPVKPSSAHLMEHHEGHNSLNIFKYFPLVFCAVVL